MKTLIILLSSISLSGCYQTVNQFDIERATVACNGVQNIVNISANFAGDERVVCRNKGSQSISLYDVIIPQN